jgi:predicted nucleic acid-binding protein
VTSKVIDASRHPFSKEERVLVDANVWLYLFGPKPPNSSSTRSYSAVLKALQTAGTQLFLDVLVLSEFVNRYVRDQHRVMAVPGAAISSEFKVFRDSPDFIPVAQAVQRSVMLIGKFARPIDHILSKVDLLALLTEFSKGARDINDELLAEECKVHGLALLSHDADVGRADITLFTTNPHLLRRR